ncbi:MAG: rhomboid family intramembrane serine protease, partial [Gemmataceae bacterium]|nr:rhomboid family intramembrane serine protease [Gemmataceae bacterium]MDW8266286.1 rhomboid family intramembrane serine protease [Gemmataceae bacterium]
MVVPLFDDNTDRRSWPYVTYLLIAANLVVFVLAEDMGRNATIVYALATVPREIVTGRDVITETHVVPDPVTGGYLTIPGLAKTPGPVYLTLLTSMFLHAGWLHLLGNMLFLWIFGDNVEDALGHVRFLIFYLVCGVLAALAQVFDTVARFGLGSQEALTPCVGASGAISGVLGSYLLLFPHKRVVVILFRILTEVPAWVAIGTWFAFQIFSSWVEGFQSGVAYAAHLGGFVVGLALVKLFALGRRPTPAHAV